ncbi:MAG TPA: helix-turn-helix transcriptional regulator [Thermodesulfobacteriota bacterium]
MHQPGHLRLRAAREALGLSDAEVAGRTGLSLADYAHLEASADAARQAVDLRHLRRVCEVLGVELWDLLDLECGYCRGRGKPARELARRARHELIRARRDALGLARDALARRLDVRIEAIDSMMRDPYFLDTWPAAFVEDLARMLEVPAQALLDVPCPRCWR